MRNEAGNNISVDAFWGILPRWQHDFKKAVRAAKNFVNIRSETIHESKYYSPLLKAKQRCLIPCSYYFEHHHFDKYHKKTGKLLTSKDKVSFLVETAKRALFAVPGLYSKWYDPERKTELTTYSMLTIVSNELLSAIHNPDRMPLVIERETEDSWLDPETPEKEINKILNFQIHSEKLSAYAVAPLSGKKAKQGADIIAEQTWAKYDAEIQEIKNAGKRQIPVLQEA